ncbi:ASCH domain-containing protein [Ilumatobacter coccineus]|uniref:ASCH domain-containing protein n=1 Tax=Ilumatobacter coccineus (strain NBRC 103263 / KCTC 29153 / YM16-304) TaxID=1313172 RepID=A0A6C7EAC7_ILUCY|nr:ASCH domain-containing protein [Ilumatobacter coccineus]BAN02085.1 hypothetical protein YM304_17710 [Ilumatobacter coccineus YM16-304]
MSETETARSSESYWADFLSETGRAEDTPLYDVFHFDDNERDADELAALVLRGTKRATASLQCEYGDDSKRAPMPGDLSVVTTWAGAPVCIIETTAVDVTGFDDVDEDFAAAEGEGDGSLRHWREVHEAYFGRVCERLGREPSDGMPVVCERFRVVYPER